MFELFLRICLRYSFGISFVFLGRSLDIPQVLLRYSSDIPRFSFGKALSGSGWVLLGASW